MVGLWRKRLSILGGSISQHSCRFEERQRGQRRCGGVLPVRRSCRLPVRGPGRSPLRDDLRHDRPVGSPGDGPRHATPYHARGGLPRGENQKRAVLLCVRGKKEFYVRNGFAERPQDAPGMQLGTGLRERRTLPGRIGHVRETRVSQVLRETGLEGRDAEGRANGRRTRREVSRNSGSPKKAPSAGFLVMIVGASKDPVRSLTEFSEMVTPPPPSRTCRWPRSGRGFHLSPSLSWSPMR